MKFYTDLEKRKEIIREYIKKNPKATFKEINKNVHTKIDRVYKGGINEAYEDAGVVKPRTLKFKTREEKRKILINYIKKNPNIGGHVIKKDTKINFLTLFDSTEDLYKAAGISYPRKDRVELMKRSSDYKKNKIIELLKENPLISIEKLGRLANCDPYSLFNNFKEIYENAGLAYIKGEKRKLSKQIKIIKFIKDNPFATQREINKNCNTHVQLIFGKGIFEAYEKAGIEFPYERLKLHGAALKEIKNSALKFEEKIALKLSGYGTVNRLVKTKRGFADIILERKEKKAVIELKNYKSHEISMSQIKQLNKYLEDTNTNLGFLLCIRKPKKHSFLIGDNKVFVIDESELSRIPEIMDLW